MICYLCGSQNFQVLTTELRRSPGVVRYCSTCQLGMLESTAAELERFYAEEYRKTHGPILDKQSDYDEIFSSYVNYMGQRLAILKPYLSENVRLLEVGCSTGHFLYNVRPRVSEVVGVDYDAGAAAYAAQKCNCRTYGGTLEDIPLELESFDVVCAYQTMEHVPDPIRFAQTLTRYLKPSGKLCIEVPSLYDPLLAVLQVPSYRSFYYHEAHLFYFTPMSLVEVMRRAGLEGTVYFSQDYNILNHLSWVLTGQPQRSCHDGLSEPHLPMLQTIAPELRQALDAFMLETNQRYQQILSRFGVTENICFIGHKVD